MAEVCPSETQAFWTIGCPVRRRFRTLKVSLENCYGVSLPLPLFPGSADERMLRFKAFCSAPLERKKFDWDVYLRKLSKRSRFSIYMSLFLFRKVLPSKAPDLDMFVEKISIPSPEPDPDFMDFIRRKIPKMFPIGWDKRYERSVETAVASSSGCSELSRNKGGSRMFWLEKFGEDARSKFCDYLRGDPLDIERKPAKLSAVPTAGKVRLLTVPSAVEQLLLPFHKVLYDRISRFDWLLRGDAKPKSFKDFRRVKGEVFVSGDYESATDNLNQHVQKEILRLILQQCTSVPNSIRIQSMESLSPDLSHEGSVYNVKSGQMMGFPVSFPLLCLVNYLSFRFSVPDRNVPVKINGDDIVFRASPQVANKWIKDVGVAGLKLSIGKTLIDNSIFTLNSTLFSASDFKVVSLPMIRSKALFGTEDGYTSLPGRFSSFAPGFGGERRRRLEARFININISYINKSRRSLNRGLGINVPRDILVSSRQWGRETAYLSLPKEKGPPPTRSMWSMKPEGYFIDHKESRHVYTKDEKKELIEAVVSSAWKTPSNVETFEEVYDGGLNYPKFNILKMSKMAGCTVADLRKAIALSRDKVWSDYLRVRKRLYPFWKKVSDQPSLVTDDTDDNQDEKAVPEKRLRLMPMIFSSGGTCSS